MIVTPLCELLGIRHPIVQGGMAWVSTAELVVAVSEAGGLGIIGAGNAPPDYVRDQVRSVKDATDKPYAVNVPLFSPFVEPVLDVCIEEGVPVVATGAGSPAPYIPRLKEAGIKKGSDNPLLNKVATITKEQLLKIVELKIEDLNTDDREQAAKIIAGSCRSMGVEIVG